MSLRDEITRAHCESTHADVLMDEIVDAVERSELLELGTDPMDRRGKILRTAIVDVTHLGVTKALHIMIMEYVPKPPTH